MMKKSHATNKQSCGRDLPKERADAPKVWSDVYKKGTRARNLQADVRQCGRSMVEMLGVLAIIGVLSVGAIAGYSRAMMKYKLNKHAEQISTLVSVGVRYHPKFLDVTGNINASLITLGEIPQEMYSKGSTNFFFYDIFKNKPYFYRFSDRLVLFVNVYTNQGDNDSLEICRHYFLVAKEFQDDLTVVFLRSNMTSSDQHIEDEGYRDSNLYGSKRCARYGSKVKCLKDLTLADIDTICRWHNNTWYEFEYQWYDSDI